MEVNQFGSSFSKACSGTQILFVLKLYRFLFRFSLRWEGKFKLDITNHNSQKIQNVQIRPKINIWPALIMMNCFCAMVYRRKAFSLISSWDHCQRFSPSQISDMQRAGFETRSEPEITLRWLKLCSSDNHYTIIPCTIWSFYSSKSYLPFHFFFILFKFT